MDYYGRPPYGYSQNKPPNDAYYQTERPPPQPLAQPPILSEDENPGDSYSGLAGWWIESEGIEHRVIQTDIARYLGNDATVRRGDRDVGCLSWIGLMFADGSLGSPGVLL